MFLEQKGQSICVYSTTRLAYAAATVCRWWQVFTEYDGSGGKYVLVFPGGWRRLVCERRPSPRKATGPSCLTIPMRSIWSACRRLERGRTPGPYAYEICCEKLRWIERHLCLTLIRRIPTLSLHNGGSGKSRPCSRYLRFSP